MADIFETLTQRGDFRTLDTALRTADQVGTLMGIGPYTLFAPNDDAFSKLPQETLMELLEDIPRLKQVMEYHIVEGEFEAEELEERDMLRTLEGEDLIVSASDGGLQVDNAAITERDIACDNGIIHVIDRVLMPKVAAERRK